MSDQKMYQANCSKCGNPLPPSRLDHAKISKAMGSSLLCDNCVPARYRMMMGSPMFRHQRENDNQRMRIRGLQDGARPEAPKSAGGAHRKRSLKRG
jgi:hypothetical protein